MTRPAAWEFCWIMPAHFGSGLDAQLALVGTTGRIEVHGLDQGLRVADEATLQFPDTTRWVEYDDGTAGGILTAEIAHFVRCVREGATPAVSIEDGLATVRVAEAIERSLRERCTVHVNW